MFGHGNKRWLILLLVGWAFVMAGLSAPNIASGGSFCPLYAAPAICQVKFVGPSATLTAYVRRDLAVSVAYWNKIPACGNIVRVVPHAPISNEIADAVMGGGYCDIWVTPDFWKYKDNVIQRCQILVHEYGHLVGQPHNSNVDSVMYSGPVSWAGSFKPGIVGGCATG